MSWLSRLIKKADKFQQSHRFTAFAYAVVKKYGDDNGAYQAALITYYGFLSLFPLLIVLTSALQLFLRSHQHLQQTVISYIADYFPVVSAQLEKNIHSPHKAGLALVLSILITLYGARGGADAFRHALNHIWQIPRPERAGFPMNVLKSLGIIAVGGGGLISATIFSSAAASLGHGFIFRALATLISIVILFGVFIAVFKLALSSSKIGFRDFVVSALIAAVGLQILQSIGGFIITHELKNLTSLYGTFALVLGILFWIYLQVQVILYAIEVDTVRFHKLWPRSLTQDPMTAQDKKAYAMYAQKERYHPDPPEKIDVKFKRQ